MGVQTAQAAWGTHTYRYFLNLAGSTVTSVCTTTDGQTYAGKTDLTAVHNSDGAVTPTVLYRYGKLWMIVCIKNTLGQQLHWNLWSVDPNTLVCTFVQELDFSSVIGTGASAGIWSGQWFVDNDGSVHVFGGGSADVSGDTGFAVYEIHPTNNSDFTQAWSAPVAIAGSGLPNNLIDPFVTREGNIYYMLVKDENTKFIILLSSASLLTGWTVLHSGNWMGIGVNFEAPFTFTIGGQLRGLWDNQGNGIYTSVSSSSSVLGFAGQSSSLITIGFAPQHGMVV